MKTIAELTDASFDQTVATAIGPVVVDFYAPWCGPCKMLAPLLEVLAEHFTGRIQFFKVNVEESPALADRFQISGVPTLAILQDGTIRDQIIGFPAPERLAAQLHALTTASATEVSV